MSIPAQVIERFARKRKIAISEAQSVFAELEQFLSYATNRSSTPPPNIDDAWHEFILDTENYANYCDAQFGRFIHHVPTSQKSCKCATGF